MYKFSKRVQYGLTALLHFLHEKAASPAATRTLSELYGIPEEHLGKVLQKMARGGLLESVQGAHGGYKMIRTMDEISLGELVDVVDGLPPQSSGPLRHHACGRVCVCYVRGVLDVSQELIRKRMLELTLSELLAQTGKQASA